MILFMQKRYTFKNSIRTTTIGTKQYEYKNRNASFDNS